MSADLFLIAHKVRGEPAFDIAQHMQCPRCNATEDHCPQCDGVGHWWIIPTSGHRAYPSDYAPLSGFYSNMGERILDVLALPSANLRDHYLSEAEAAKSLLDTLGLAKPKPQAPIVRRL